MTRVSAAAIAIAWTCALVACAGPSPAPETRGVQRSPIVGGTAAPARSTPIVSLSVGGGTCTGTVVAPNLILTAKHCVTNVIGASHNCDENGNTFIDYDAGTVETTPDAGWFGPPRPIETLSVGRSGQSPSAPHVAQVLVASGATVCKTDLAMLVLDRPMDDPTVAAIRLDHTVQLGDHLVASGWGFVMGMDPATSLQQRDVTVVAVGPQAKRLSTDGAATNGAVPPTFFEIGEGLCYGDSGSPALTVAGAVVGVASGVDNPYLEIPSGTATDCADPSVRGVYAELSSDRDFVMNAFASAGAAPWLEGNVDPRAALKDFEAECAGDAECKSNVCVGGSDAGLRCSHGCLETPCPSGYRCEDVGNRRRCLAGLPADEGSAFSTSSSSGGCAVVPTPASRKPDAPAASWTVAMVLAATFVGRRRIGLRRPTGAASRRSAPPPT